MLPRFCLTFCLLCNGFIAGCKTYHPATISVADHAGKPVENATAIAAPMYFFNPTSKNLLFIGAYDILEPFPAEGDQGRTNEQGNVTLQIVTESPLQLNVFANGFIPWTGQISISAQNEPEVKKMDAQSDLMVTVN